MSRSKDEVEIRALLLAARQARKVGKNQQAELKYRQAADVAEAGFGPQSAVVALVLLDLIEFYDAQPNRESVEVAVLHGRIRGILAGYAQRDRALLCQRIASR